MERWLALVLAGMTLPATAQVGVPSPAPAAAPGVSPVTLPDELPAGVGDELDFLTAEDRMTVPVEIAGAGPFPFIIDTGAQRSVISRQLAAHLGLPRGRRVRLVAMAGTSDVDTVIIPAITVSPRPVGSVGGERIEAPALEARHLGAPGMLGIDTLQGQALTIDFDSQRMQVTPSSKRERLKREPGEIVIQARSLFGQLVVTSATVAGRRVRVVLDTGTSVSLGNLALRRLLSGRRGETTMLTSVLGVQLAADYALLPEMTLGPAKIRSLPIAFADAAPFRVFGIDDKPALMLGMDALRLFRRVHIDFANRELRLLLPRDLRYSG
ncbi:aspartyl protease family protein [Sphingomonas sp. RHCKR7]|uniref:retroviral-like aspartic protease family protein n=1 Tax=Sphingomonas folli TaxID=2862497 RepID=UPI001CA4F910|nr:retroviral-like aspartic protease family protein [Sphingomonas folli]MBW6528066.1 aspartyl protease family protein [Sphingomonas folli]